jgi:hypothetical protein
VSLFGLKSRDLRRGTRGAAELAGCGAWAQFYDMKNLVERCLLEFTPC